MEVAAYLQILEDLRASVAEREAVADAARDQLYAAIQNRPAGVSKMDLHRASGVSRPTIDSLLATGQPWSPPDLRKKR